MKREMIDPKALELSDKVVAIKRVSKTVKGGRTMRFQALVVVGDRNEVGHLDILSHNENITIDEPRFGKP